MSLTQVFPRSNPSTVTEKFIKDLKRDFKKVRHLFPEVLSCDKAPYLVEACANETDLDYVNPLEILPQGDCDLAEVKQKFGHKLAFMGNLHTTDVMLFGSTQDVRREALKAIVAAGENGGFVLSTGDQCGRDTPFENIFEIVNVAKEFGSYPLDFDRIRDEMNRLDKLTMP